MAKLKKGDNVKILLGKDRGKTGTVERMMPQQSKALVLGANMYKRHIRKQANVEGRVIDIVKPIDISNLALICPNCKRPARIKFKVADGRKDRVCIRCNKVIGMEGKKS